MRHLTEQQAAAALRRGGSIEQLLTTTLDEGTVRWLSIAAADGGFALRRHAVLNDGDDDFLDVYEFRPADEDVDVGDGIMIGRFADALTAFEAASQNGARMSRWVNGGVIQDEYADLRSAG
ncbi:hypothetical protein [Nocardioides dilutus]